MLGVAMFTASTVTVVGLATAGTAGAAKANKSPILVGEALWNNPSAVPQYRYPGTNAAIRTLNAAGGVKGHPIQIDRCLAADANSGVACAAQFVKDGVVATVTDVNTQAEVAYTQAMAAAGIPMIDPYISSPQALASPNVFLINGGSAAVYAAEPAMMKLAGYKTYNIVAFISAAATALEPIIQKAASFYGLTQVGTTTFALTTADFQPVVAQAAASKADAQAMVTTPGMTQLFLNASETLAEPVVISVNAGQFNLQTIRKFGAPGGSLAGAILPWAIPPTSAAKKYPGVLIPAKSIQAYYKASQDTTAAPDQVTAFATGAWVDMDAFQKIASTISGDVTAASMMTALNNAKNVNLLGIIKWTPSAQGPTGFTRISNPYEYFITVKNGQEVLARTKPVNSMLPFK
jgi:ABC-type branched-subunit amino acid transport system substrate-binding protein